MTNKNVVWTFGSGSTHWVGDGFHVRNLFPSNGVSQEVDPFLMLDYAGPTQFAPSDRARGVGEHPHRGFETVTIAYQGSVDHRDSGGNAGTIRPGDVQWMTAGSGVVHEEKHEREFTKQGGTFEMIQLWVNLPKAHKMTAPRYQAITKEQIPIAELGPAGYARVIAGELHGAKGPAKTFTPINVFDVRLNAGHEAVLNLTEGHNTALVLLKGNVGLGSSREIEGEARLALLSADGETVALEARQDSTLLVLSGEPIGEPVASYGPFVMNTQEELAQAVKDYSAGKMGRVQ
ncbi:MAG: pirin family protein [Bryobacterales bacterium]